MTTTCSPASSPSAGPTISPRRATWSPSARASRPDALADAGVPLQDCRARALGGDAMTVAERPAAAARRPSAAGMARGHAPPPRSSRARRSAMAAALRQRAARLRRAGELVARLASRTELWKPLVVCDRSRRRYRLMFEDARLDVWVLSWMPGQATGYHDHGSLERRPDGAPGMPCSSADPRRAARASSSDSGRASCSKGPAGLHPFRRPRRGRARGHAARVLAAARRGRPVPGRAR